MSRGIFLIQSDNKLIEMKEQPYLSEDLLQRYLANYPRILAGDEINPTQPRKWLLVTREASLPSEEGGGGRWAVDNLFLDQDAIPTIVEVKRSSDTRIRREVVGQMLDYAANTVVYWSIEALRSQFERHCQNKGVDVEQELTDFLGPYVNPESFWRQVKTNLQAGKVRLIFVADVIPVELRRIVEFLNEQMDPAEVLAIEIKQYVSQDSKIKTLVPNVLGQTAEAQQRKSSVLRAQKQWDEPSFLQKLEERSTVEANVARKILDWARSRTTPIWGQAPQRGSFTPVLQHKGNDNKLFRMYTEGYVEIPFKDYQKIPPFDAETKRLDLFNKLNSIDGLPFSSDKISLYPSIPLSILGNERDLAKFFEAFEWFIREVRTS